MQQAHSHMAGARIESLRASALLHVCAVTVAELLYSARNADEMQADEERISRLGVPHIDRDEEQQVTLTMKQLASAGQHRAQHRCTPNPG